jgi:phosphoribosylformimino-5-aminoimidazole carboxamide ribotide isomerase
MQILPVLDVMGGHVVRAVGGRRAEYRPLVSRLTASTDPLTVARAIRDRFGWTELYVADLDAIMGGRWSADLYRRLRSDGFRLWVDAGVQIHAAAGLLLAHGIFQAVVGLETLLGPEEWRGLTAAVDPSRLTFSLDLRNGRALGVASEWGTDDPRQIAEQVVRDGGRRMLILDLARIGEYGGTGTVDLCRELVTLAPNVAVFAGGGIRDVDDIRRLRDVGVTGVLVASALHDERITPEDVRDL